MSTVSSQASTAAVLAAGLNTTLSRALHTANVPLVPEGVPGPGEVGYDIAGSKAVDVRVSLHRDNRARSIFLQIDIANAPLTGNYILILDGTTSTYNATASAPADIDALLAGWAAQILTDFTTYTAVPVAFSGVSTDDDDGILVTADVTTGVYDTFGLKTGTEAPALATLAVYRENDDVDLRLWVKSGVTVPADFALSWQTVQAQGWVVREDVGTIGPGGYDQQPDLAGRTAVWPELSGWSRAADTLAVVTVGVGCYALTDMAVVVVAPTDSP